LLHAFSLGFVLFVVWLLLSGHVTSPLLVSLGLVSSVVIVLLARRMDFVDREGHPIHLTWRAALYFPWLVKEICKACFDVARIIVDPRLPISPTRLRLEGSQGSDLGLVAYANSITLTPGTVTIGLEDGVLIVHALTGEAAGELEGGEMDRRVTAMEGSAAAKGEAP
jgi:multicomponent Na+:H+ antiporter subunit E